MRVYVPQRRGDRSGGAAAGEPCLTAASGRHAAQPGPQPSTYNNYIKHDRNRLHGRSSHLPAGWQYAHSHDGRYRAARRGGSGGRDASRAECRVIRAQGAVLRREIEGQGSARSVSVSLRRLGSELPPRRRPTKI